MKALYEQGVHDEVARPLCLRDFKQILDRYDPKAEEGASVYQFRCSFHRTGRSLRSFSKLRPSGSSVFAAFRRDKSPRRPVVPLGNRLDDVWRKTGQPPSPRLRRLRAEHSDFAFGYAVTSRPT